MRARSTSSSRDGSVRSARLAVVAVLLLGLQLAFGCGSAHAPPLVSQAAPTSSSSRAPAARPTPVSLATGPAPSAIAPSPWDDPDSTLASASAGATPGGHRVLEAVRAMLSEETVVLGSCFDWAEAVYRRAGGSSHDAFHGGRSGPYAAESSLAPGDWLFFVNHEFGDDTHSAIFVAWLDEPSHVGLVVSYAGGHREEPGRLGSYTLTSVYRVVRMVEEPVPVAGRAEPTAPVARSASRLLSRR